MFKSFSYLFTFINVIFLFSCGNQAKNDAKGLFIRGNVALKEKNYDIAIQKFDDCVQKNPDFADCYNNRGLAKQHLGNSKDAVLDFQKAVNLDEKFYQARFNLATAQFQTQQYQESLSSLKLIEKQYKDSSFYSVLVGNLNTKLHDYPSAYAAYNQAISLNKNNSEAYTNLGFVQFQENNRKDAKANFEKAISINPNQDFALNNLSLIYTKEGKFKEALSYIDKALKINASQPYYLNNKGYLLLKLNRLNEGKQLIEQSLKIDDKNAWAYRNLGIYYLYSADFQKALSNFNQAEKLDAGVEQINYYLGTTLIKLGKPTEAKQYFDIEQKLTYKNRD